MSVRSKLPHLVQRCCGLTTHPQLVLLLSAHRRLPQKGLHADVSPGLHPNIEFHRLKKRKAGAIVGTGDFLSARGDEGTKKAGGREECMGGALTGACRNRSRHTSPGGGKQGVGRSTRVKRRRGKGIRGKREDRKEEKAHEGHTSRHRVPRRGE